MLQAIDTSGNKYLAYQRDKLELMRMKCKSNEILCPDCNNPVNIKSGQKKISHFSHKPGTDCTYPYSEPESEQHLKGKIMIMEWLQKIFPKSKVELEFRVEETNQRSDVMVTHPNGDRWAFEYQCSKISGDMLLERHFLYEEAGIKDFWILGENVHRYWKTKGKIDKRKHKLIEMEDEVKFAQNALYYLDSEQENLRMIYSKDLKWVGDTIIECEETISNLFEAFIWKDTYIVNTESEKKFNVQYEKRISVSEQTRKQDQEVLDIARDKFVMIRNRLLAAESNMTEKELKLYRELKSKHQLNNMNFPGVFLINTKTNDFIVTPEQLWQLWIYDKYIYKKAAADFDKVHVPSIKKDFQKMINWGVFRVKQRNDGHWSFPIYEYIRTLSRNYILRKLSRKNDDLNQILVDDLPLYSDINKNIFIAMMFEEMPRYGPIEKLFNTINEFYRDIGGGNYRIYFGSLIDDARIEELKRDIRKDAENNPSSYI